jgi:hypothetical protein
MPLAGHVLGMLAALTVFSAVWIPARTSLAAQGFPAQGSLTDSIIHLLEGPVIVIGIVALGILAMRRGIRERRRYVPKLITILTRGDKSARRKAILAFDEIAAFDLASARKNGRVFERVIRRWFFPNDTPAVTANAVSVLEAALNDDDRFVRIQAAKVLTRMGVKLDLE